MKLLMQIDTLPLDPLSVYTLFLANDKMSLPQEVIWIVYTINITDEICIVQKLFCVPL